MPALVPDGETWCHDPDGRGTLSLVMSTWTAVATATIILG